MFLSIILPTFNRSEYIKPLVESVFSQGFEDLEIIIVDDGSDDDTGNVVKEIITPRIKYLRTENQERGAARNFGLTYATGDYVNFFDSDDLYKPCLGQLYDFMEQNKWPVVVYGDIEHIDSNGRAVIVSPVPYSSFTKNLIHNNFLACGSVFLKREIAKAFPFHENRKLSSAEDWELWLRLHSAYNFTFFPLPVFQQVHHPQRSLMTIDPERVEIRDTYFASIVLENRTLREFYGRNVVRLFAADRYTYISLCYCGKNWPKAYYFWFRSLLTSLSVVKRKRLWAVLKKLLFL